MDKTELVLHLVWFIFVFQYTIITPWYSMAWSMGWDYFADLICLNFNESVKLKQRTIAKLRKFSLFSFFQFLPQYDFGFPSRSSYVASCWEGSYPSSTNLVPQTNFKVLKNSQNLDLWGLKQLLRIHLLTKLLLLHLLCFGADFASLLHSIGLGSSPKRLHLICSYWDGTTIHRAF